MGTNIHSTAVVDPAAQIGSDVTIGPFAIIEGDAKLGNRTRVGPHVTVFGNTTIGADCEIHAGAILGDKPQDLSFEDVKSYVKIGDKCTIREGVTIHRGTKEESLTEIGDACFLMAFSHFAHNVKLGNNIIVANGALLAGHVEVGDRAFISGNVVIHQFVKVGRLVMVGGGSALNKDLPPFCTTRSADLNNVMGLNSIGLTRAGMTTEDRKDVKQAFKILYKSGQRVSEAVKMIENTFSSGPALEFVDFVKASTRGICWKGAVDSDGLE